METKNLAEQANLSPCTAAALDKLGPDELLHELARWIKAELESYKTSEKPDMQVVSCLDSCMRHLYEASFLYYASTK